MFTNLRIVITIKAYRGGKSVMSNLDSKKASQLSKSEILNIRKSFGQRIKGFRKANHLSQEELAQLSSLHRNYISDTERGRRNISFEAMIKLASGLGMNIRDLL